VTAERDYDAGELFVMSYGLKSSAQCLEDHGIVPALDLFDSCCEFVGTIDLEKDRFPDDKVAA
jgi:hypothetical protein